LRTVVDIFSASATVFRTVSITSTFNHLDLAGLAWESETLVGCSGLSLTSPFPSNRATCPPNMPSNFFLKIVLFLVYGTSWPSSKINTLDQATRKGGGSVRLMDATALVICDIIIAFDFEVAGLINTQMNSAALPRKRLPITQLCKMAEDVFNASSMGRGSSVSPEII
jgi:hypothetical protein